MSVSLTFPDSTYSSSNKPSTATLKTDLQAIETDHNAHLADATIHFLASTLYPVSIIVEFKVSTNPATLFGFGTWAAYGTGRVTVAIDAGQTEFDTVEETGGAKTHTLQTTEMPSHTHIQDAHSHVLVTNGGSTGSGNFANVSGGSPDQSTQTTVATNQNTGGGGAHNNLQPYIVVYRWVRTA